MFPCIQPFFGLQFCLQSYEGNTLFIVCKKYNFQRKMVHQLGFKLLTSCLRISCSNNCAICALWFVMECCPASLSSTHCRMVRLPAVQSLGLEDFFPALAHFCFMLGFSSKVSSPCTQFRLGNSKAAAHVAVDLQCWHCKALIE